MEDKQDNQEQFNSNVTELKLPSTAKAKNVPSAISCRCPTASTILNVDGLVQPCPNVVTIPVPILHNEERYTYITVKGSLHDSTCTIFGLNVDEEQALTKRFANTFKRSMNGIMISVPAMSIVNTMAELGYKVVCSSGEAEICWTMEREI